MSKVLFTSENTDIEMNMNWASRTIQLIGEDQFRKLQRAHILIAGLGGVGSMATEMLARAGVGKFTIIDSDSLQLSNLNRQIHALHSTMNLSKSEVMKQRLLDINPGLEIIALEEYIQEDTIDGILDGNFDFVVDAIDTLTPKILFIEKALEKGFSFTSSMGSGGKTDPSMIAVEDFGKTYNCRLAYILRKKLRKRGIEGGFPVVFSKELIDKERLLITDNEKNKKSIPGTISYIPAIFGCYLASIVVDGLIYKL